MQKDYYSLPDDTIKQLKALDGPIAVFGAGGFIGINVFLSLLKYRDDVYGISQDKANNWRFIASGVPIHNLIECDITDFSQLEDAVKSLKPRTILNLAAYGAYSKQKEYRKIYYTNFNSSVDMLEILKTQGFSAYVHAGSSSEYGINSAAPAEDANLVPNSHYALSKVAMSYAIKYFGQIEELPVVHLRLYSAYGPWEEPDRLMPVLLSHGRNKKYPPLVDPKISRDFIYVTDITSAFIAAAAKANTGLKGDSVNIGTGTKTTIMQLAQMVKQVCNIPADPSFGTMQNRAWDMPDWYANPQAALKKLDWKAQVKLQDGLKDVIQWQEEIGFDNANWNWTKNR